MSTNLKRILFIIFLMIYIAIVLDITGCSNYIDKCHYKDGEEDAISLEMSKIMSREYNNKTIQDKKE